jgi:hypothetical protein
MSLTTLDQRTALLVVPLDAVVMRLPAARPAPEATGETQW